MRRVKLLFSHINTGKSINDKLKIALICIIFKRKTPKAILELLGLTCSWHDY